MYRPTVRYSDIYRTYVNNWFHATVLNRNQIIRCALFTAAHNPLFLQIMNQYKKSDVTPPSPLWSLSDDQVWLEQDIELEKREEVGIHDVYTRKTTTANVAQESRASKASGSVRGANIIYKDSTAYYKKQKEQTRRQQSAEGYTRTLPSVQLSNNGGIRLDLR